MSPVTKTVRVEEDNLGEDHELAHTSSTAAAIVYYIAGLLSLLLGLRFLLQLLGANNTGVVNWVYAVTQPFVAPFYGIFGTTVLYGNARIEWESLLAIVAVGIIAYVIAGFLRLFRM
jgi:hypothetical protein